MPQSPSSSQVCQSPSAKRLQQEVETAQARQPETRDCRRTRSHRLLAWNRSRSLTFPDPQLYDHRGRPRRPCAPKLPATRSKRPSAGSPCRSAQTQPTYRGYGSGPAPCAVGLVPAGGKGSRSQLTRQPSTTPVAALGKQARSGDVMERRAIEGACFFPEAELRRTSPARSASLRRNVPSGLGASRRPGRTF